MSHDVWEYQVSELAQDYHTVVLDLRGHGDSDKPWGSYSYDVFAKDIRTAVQKLGLGKFTFVGWSLGGAIGTLYAARHASELNGLVSVDGAVPYFVRTSAIPAGPTKDEVNRWIDQESSQRPEFTKQFVDSMFYNSVGAETKLWIWDICMKASWNAAIQSLITLRDTDLVKLLPNVKVPTAVFHGAHDTVVPYEFGQFTAGKISNAKLVPFHRSGHVPFIEEKQKFNQELTRFIEQQPRQRPKSRWFRR